MFNFFKKKKEVHFKDEPEKILPTELDERIYNSIITNPKKWECKYHRGHKGRGSYRYVFENKEGSSMLEIMYSGYVYSGWDNLGIPSKRIIDIVHNIIDCFKEQEIKKELEKKQDKYNDILKILTVNEL